jgi:translation initiation factor 1 (eIF-1/SUI1)
MSSIIINCFYRALTNIDENEGIKNLSVKQLTRLLVDQLYPEDGVLVWENEDTLKIRRTPAVQVVTVPVEAPAEPAVVATEVKEVKVKEVKPKLTKEEKAAAKAAKPAKAPKASKVKTPEPVSEPEPVVSEPEPEPVPAPAPAPEEPKVKEVKPKAAKEPKEPKAKFVGNLEKLTPTQDKLLKKTAADGNVHFEIDTKAKFIAFVNAMDNKDFNAKKLEEHMKAFFAPKEPEVKEADCTEVEFKGKTYWVDVNNGDVYEPEKQEDGSEVDKKVGKVGLLYFADMKMPVE